MAASHQLMSSFANALIFMPRLDQSVPLMEYLHAMKTLMLLLSVKIPKAYIPE